MSEFLAYAGEVTNPLPLPAYVYLVSDYIMYDSSAVIAAFLNETDARTYADTEPLYSDFRMIDRIPINVHFRPSEPRATNDFYPESTDYRRDR